MPLPATGRISMGDINVELGRSRNATISLDVAENGTYVAINQNSASKPSSTNPATISEWRSYNHSTVSSFGYQFAEFGSSTGLDACSFPASQRTLYTSSFYLVIGSRLFINSNVTTAFNGFDSYYLDIMGDKSYQINSTGYITAEYNCSFTY
jgi:hypothetical protein